MKNFLLGFALIIGLSLFVTDLPQRLGAQSVNPAERTIFSCLVNASTATSLTALGGQCAAPGSSRSFYITDIVWSASAASTTSADAAMTIKYGTGGTCGTGTTSVWASGNAANQATASNRQTPIRIPHNNELCWIHSVAGTKWAVVSGYIDK